MKTIKIFLLIIAVVIAYKAKSATMDYIRLLYSKKIITQDTNISNLHIHVIQIDKCEYIVTDAYRTITMVHKQDCSYCKTLKSK